MDGNGRWAKKKGNERIFGHKNGVKAVRETVEAAAELGVGYLTLYAFSMENWKRPKLPDGTWKRRNGPWRPARFCATEPFR